MPIKHPEAVRALARRDRTRCHLGDVGRSRTGQHLVSHLVANIWVRTIGSKSDSKFVIGIIILPGVCGQNNPPINTRSTAIGQFRVIRRAALNAVAGPPGIAKILASVLYLSHSQQDLEQKIDALTNSSSSRASSRKSSRTGTRSSTRSTVWISGRVQHNVPYNEKPSVGAQRRQPTAGLGPPRKRSPGRPTCRAVLFLSPVSSVPFLPDAPSPPAELFSPPSFY